MDRHGISAPPFPPAPDDVSPKDVYAAMRELGNYYDITADDFRDIYRHAFALARARLLADVQAAALMTSPVVSVPHTATLGEAAALLDRRHISGAPVTDGDGRMVGMLSEKDIRRRIGEACGIAVNTALSLLRARIPEERLAVLLDEPARGVMRTEVFSARPDTSLGALLELFAARNINRAPVLDADGGLLGIVSRSDILGGLGGAA